MTIEAVAGEEAEAGSDIGDPADYLAGVRAGLAAVQIPRVMQVLSVFERAYAAGRTIYLCGNGGSAATASHFAVDLGKGTRCAGAPPLRVVSLADQLSALTAWANDESYDSVFAAQLAAFVVPGDVVVGISTSGNSANVLEALRYARRAGAVTVALLGANGGKARHLADVCVLAPGGSMEQEEDIHLVLTHAMTRHMRRVVRASRSGSSGGRPR